MSLVFQELKFKEGIKILLETSVCHNGDGLDVLEKVVDSNPCIKIKDGKPWFRLQKARGGWAKVIVHNLNANNLETIFRVLSLIKRSTCKEDKLYLRHVSQILKDKQMEEIINDTTRVKGFPKRITMYMFSKKASLEFEGVKSINSTTYLSEMLKKLEEPAPVNALEVEAIDLVKSRLNLVTEEIRQLREKKNKEKKEATKQLQGRKP